MHNPCLELAPTCLRCATFSEVQAAAQLRSTEHLKPQQLPARLAAGDGYCHIVQTEPRKHSVAVPPAAGLPPHLTAVERVAALRQAVLDEDALSRGNSSQGVPGASKAKSSAGSSGLNGSVTEQALLRFGRQTN